MGIGKRLSQLKNRLIGGVADSFVTMPLVRKQVDKEIENILASASDGLKPYREEFPSYNQLPQDGRGYDELLLEIVR